MKLWFTTANEPQQSRCSKIGSPEGEKMPTYDYYSSFIAFMRRSRQILWIIQGSCCVIHESRLLQMRGAVHEAVVYHREWAATKQVR